jgi:hypothetical protein
MLTAEAREFYLSPRPGVRGDTAANAKNDKVYDNALRAFINQLRAQSGKALTSEQAGLL